MVWCNKRQLTFEVYYQLSYLYDTEKYFIEWDVIAPLLHDLQNNL